MILWPYISVLPEPSFPSDTDTTCTDMPIEDENDNEDEVLQGDEFDEDDVEQKPPLR